MAGDLLVAAVGRLSDAGSKGYGSVPFRRGKLIAGGWSATACCGAGWRWC